MVAPPTASAASAATGATAPLLATPLLALEEAGSVKFAGLHLAGLDHASLLVKIVSLHHDLELVALPGRCRVQGDEDFGELFGMELDKNRALEGFIVGRAAKLDKVDSAVVGEPRLDIELRGWALFAEALNIDALGHLLLLDIRNRDIWLLALDHLLVLLTLNLEEVASLEGGNNSGVWLESAHPFEVAQSLEQNRFVLLAAGALPHKLVDGQVAIAEVELYLGRKKVRGK